MINIPDRASNAGPESSEDLDWRDQLWVADENVAAARRMEQDSFDYEAAGEKRNRSRIEAINHAIAALQEARELLCR